MANLLPEVLLHIFSFLDTKSLNNLRLTCRSFNKIATCHAFKYIVFYVKDLKMLDEVSQNPDIAKNIHSLGYNADLLPLPALECSEFAERVGGNYVAFNGYVPLMPAIEQRFKEYRDAVSEQRRAVDSKDDFTVLKRVMARLPALKDISIWSRKYSIFLADIVESPPYFKKHLEDLGMISKCYLPEGVRQTDAVLEALGGIEARPTRLCVSPLHWSFFTSPRNSVIRAKPTLEYLTEVAIKLTRNLYDHIGQWEGTRIPSEAEDCHKAMRRGFLKSFLANLKALERISISFDDVLENQDAAAQFTDVVETGHRWEFLKSFAIGRVDCERQEIMAFLQLHASTLEKVEFDHLHLRTTSWMILLPDMQYTLKLKDADITGVLVGKGEGVHVAPGALERWWLGSGFDDAELAKAIQKYLLKGGNMPLNTDNMWKQT